MREFNQRRLRDAFVKSTSTSTRTNADGSKVVAVKKTWSDGKEETISTTFDKLGNKVSSVKGDVSTPSESKVQPVPAVTVRPNTQCSLNEKVVKAAFAEQNRIRTSPKEVAQTVWRQIFFFEEDSKTLAILGETRLTTQEGKQAWFEARQQLQSQQKLDPFEWSDALALAAKDHCEDAGPLGIMGHKGSDGSSLKDRILRYGDWQKAIAENIAYGSSDGADYIVQLYIDDGVANRGHRTNMLNPKLNWTGMHACDHKKFGRMIVIVYSAGMVPNSKVPSCDSNTNNASTNTSTNTSTKPLTIVIYVGIVILILIAAIIGVIVRVMISRKKNGDDQNNDSAQNSNKTVPAKLPEQQADNEKL